MTPKFIIYILASILPATALAQSAFDSAVQSIVNNNAELKAKHQRYVGEIENEKNENLLEGPEAELEYKFAPEGGENRWGVSVSQSFDWPGLYSARRKVAANNENAFRQLYEADRNAVAHQARTLLLDYVQARLNASLLAEAETNLSQLIQYLDKAYERESATILMVKKARRELFDTSARRAEAEAAVQRIAESLKAMGDGNIDLSGINGFPEIPLLPMAEYRQAMLANDPTLAAHASLIDAQNASVTASKAGRLPSFSLGYVHDFEEGTHFNGFSVGISLPSWGRNHSASAARANALAAEFEKEDYAQSVEASIASDWNEAAALATRLEPVKDEFADDNYIDLLSKSFYGGQITIFDYLREINEYIDFKISLTALEHSYCSALTRLNRYTTVPQ